VVKYLLPFLLVGCSWFEHHDKKESEGPYPEIAAMKAAHCGAVTDPYDHVDKCDASTFVGIYDVFCKRIDIYAHEYPEGQWHRNPEPCYETGESRSEISFESMLGNIWPVWDRGDIEAIEKYLMAKKQKKEVRLCKTKPS